jgi:hypothetical protein
MKSLYSQADLDAMGEGFAVMCTEEKATKLLEDSVVMAS